MPYSLTISQTTKLILYASKLKEFAGDNFMSDQNGGNFSIRVENTVGKGEIALHEQLHLFPKCFQKLVLQICKNKGLFGKELNLGKIGIHCSSTTHKAYT